MAQQSSDKSGNILQEILLNGQLAWHLYTDRRVSMMLKVLIPVAALIYFIIPVDLLPDFIPIIGQLDEVAIMLLLVRLFISLAPPEVVAEYKAKAGPSAQASSKAGAAAGGNGSAPKAGRDDVIDADFRVVNDGQR